LRETVLNFLEALIADLRRRFPTAQFSIIEGRTRELRLNSPNLGLGFVTVEYDGEEATVCAGELTHGHFNPYDASLSAEARVRWVCDAVMGFLGELLNDRVVVWSSGPHRGGWTMIEPGTTMVLPEGVSAHLWSRPLSAAP
jgi:hypothetical protein